MTTDESGYFRAAKLPPASYMVTVEAPGLAPYTAESVVVQASRREFVSCERYAVELLGEAFNIFNHQNVTVVTTRATSSEVRPSTP